MYYYNNEMPPKEGWVCPRCGRVNAPWLPCCDCQATHRMTTYMQQTTGIKWTRDTTTTNPKGSGMIDASGKTDCSWQKEE